jgi:hypothetical protein
MFIYTLSFLFANSSLLNPIEFLFIITLLYFLLYFTAPYPDKTETGPATIGKQTSFLQHIYAALSGEMALWLVFWPYFLLLNLILITADSLAVTSRLSVSSWDDILLVAVSSSLIWTAAIWRSSWQTKSRIWAALARLLTLCAFFDYAMRILIRVEYPRAFFNCAELLLNYSSCF